jgi:hypothetical protein
MTRIALAVLGISLAGLTGCGGNASIKDSDSAQDELRSIQRTTFEGVSVGFGDSAAKLKQQFTSKGLAPQTEEVLGAGRHPEDARASGN